MQIVIDIPIPSRGQNIINIPIHYCGGQVVDAGGYGFEERKTGKWKYSPIDDTEHCTACDYRLTMGALLALAGFPVACPNCGAKMEVDDADSN